MRQIDSGPEVRVTVTTIRSDRSEGTRQAASQGPFDRAVCDALQVRLAPWAVGQVLGRVLALRPPVGDAAEYEGSFSPTRHIQVVVTPLEGQETPVCRTRRLSGLSLLASGCSSSGRRS
jgi:hypothetical protein